MNIIYNSENNFSENNKKEEEEPLALLNLEIEKGVIKQIKLFKNSNPEEVSYKFCKENNIDFSLMNHIKNEIESLLQKYFENVQKETELKEYNISSDNEQNIEQNYNNNNNDEILNNNYNSFKHINQSKSNLYNNNQKSKRNLFFYQFLQNEKNQNKQKNLSKSKSANKYKIKYFNTINYNNNIIKKDTKNSGSSSLRFINDSYLTHNFTTINNSNFNRNIFERLYNDAKIKRLVYRRPCHYCSQSKENKIFEDTMSNIYETINGKTINKMDLDMKSNYIRSYQIRPHQLLSKECSFQPNSFKNRNSYINKIDTYHLNSTHQSYNFLEDNKSSNKYYKTSDNIRNNNNFNGNYLTYNNNTKNSQTKKNVLYEENYIPLKNKTKFFSIIEDNIEMLSFKAFSNLFSLLTNNDQSKLLNKNTININNIDNNTVSILSQIIQDINNNSQNIELNFDDFLKRIFNEITDEDKKFLIYNYSNVETNKNNKNYNNQNNQSIRNSENFRHSNFNKNKRYKFSENNSRAATINNFHKRYRLTSGTEKKRNFYYI